MEGVNPLKLNVEKSTFLKSWQMAERSTGNRSTVSILSGIKCSAEEDRVVLQATDLKTGLTCRAEGVTVELPGEAVFPIKVVGELFKKAPGKTFSIEIKDGKAEILSERSRYTFTTYAVEEFPKLPSSSEARLFCDIKAGELNRLLDEGTFAGSPNEEFPQYLSAALFQIVDGRMCTVSTDGRRLSLSKVDLDSTQETESNNVLLPLAGLREFSRILGNVDPDAPVRFLTDDSQAYFQTEGMEFSVRQIESNFPPYEKILTKGRTTWITVGRSDLIEVLERTDVVVRDFSKMVVLHLEPGGNLYISGKAPNIGEANETVIADIDGEPLRIAFNVRYLLDGLKALHAEVVQLGFNGPHGQMTMTRPGEETFVYVLMPITLPDSEENEEVVSQA